MPRYRAVSNGPANFVERTIMEYGEWPGPWIVLSKNPQDTLAAMVLDIPIGPQCEYGDREMARKITNVINDFSNILFGMDLQCKPNLEKIKKRVLERYCG